MTDIVYAKIPGGWRCGSVFLGFHGIGKTKRQALESFNHWHNKVIRDEDWLINCYSRWLRKSISVIMRDHKCDYWTAANILSKEKSR